MGEVQMNLELGFQAAMVDAMNRFAQEVLLARGLISPDAFDRITDRNILDAKYAIARECAAKWAAMYPDALCHPRPAD